MDLNSKEIKLFYLSFSVYNFATSIVQIFIPLFFYNKGFPLSVIILFFAITQIGRISFLPVAAYLSSSFGAKKVLSAAFAISIFYYLLLSKIESLSLIYYVSALAYGVVQAFLWLPFLVHLSKISPNENKGKIYSRLNIYSSIANATGPILGGFIISLYGFGYVFYAVIGLIIPAIYFLSLTPEASKIRKINFKLISVKKVYPDLVANGSFNLQVYLLNTLWPIFIFLILPEYNTIGFIQTMSLFISLIAFHFVGKWTDKFRRKKVLLAGSVLNSVFCSLRIFAGSFLSVFALNSTSIFTGVLQGVPWNVKLQEHMEREPRVEYTMFFEIGGAFITFAGLFIFIFAIQYFSLRDALVFGIIAGSLSGLFVNLIRE